MSRKATILAVDDTYESLALLEKILTSAGFHVLVADSGELALAAVAANPPDLILLDVRMKGMDGLEVCRQLKAHDETKRIPIILISAFANEKEWVEGLQLGVSDYITKPFKSEELLMRVKTHMTLSRANVTLEQQAAELCQINEQLQSEIIMRQRVEDDLRRNLDRAERSRLAMLSNLEDRKRMEAEKSVLEVQFQQAQKLEAVGLLTGGVAHDFNNLLTTIIGNAELAIGEVGKDSPLHEFLEDIKGAGERAAALTRQLLAFSRKQILQPEVANLNEVLGNMDRMLRRVIQENIEIKTILSPDLGQVHVDIGQMEQILMNLAVNARDVMPEGGKLIFETSNAELDETYARTHISVTPGPYVMLAVTDTGIGMTKEVQAKIFEPFFTTKEKGKGTGLGLSTVYGIVKQSKGNIWVYSEPGKGSTFKIYLPRVEETVRIVEEPEEVAESLQGSETILLVEDEKMVRDIALKILRNYGYTVLCAGDGEEALHICRHHQEPVQLMLTDVVMPGMSGRELAKRLEELHPEMKVLFMSGYTDNAIVHNGLLDKGIAFIPKPFTPVDLARKVREVLNLFTTI